MILLRPHSPTQWPSHRFFNLKEGYIYVYIHIYLEPLGRHATNTNEPDDALHSAARATGRLLCTSFLGNILQPLVRKQVITKQELDSSLQVPPLRFPLASLGEPWMNEPRGAV